VKGLGSLKELASGRRARLSTPGREETVERPSAEYVDEQIAQLLETIEGDARAPQVLTRDEAARERPPAPAVSRKRPRPPRASGPTVSERLLGRVDWGWDQARSVATYILLGTAVGIVIGVLIGR
jgi:hypothetical protein